MSESTGTRVPRKHGVPPKISGSVTIIDSRSMKYLPTSSLAVAVPKTTRQGAGRQAEPLWVSDHQGRQTQRRAYLLNPPPTTPFPVSRSRRTHGDRRARRIEIATPDA